MQQRGVIRIMRMGWMLRRGICIVKFELFFDQCKPSIARLVTA